MCPVNLDQNEPMIWNRRATDNAMRWLVHWPLMVGLLQLIQRGGDWTGCGSAHSLPRCTRCNSPPINGQCTNFILFHTLLPLHSNGLNAPEDEKQLAWTRIANMSHVRPTIKNSILNHWLVETKIPSTVPIVETVDDKLRTCHNKSATLQTSPRWSYDKSQRQVLSYRSNEIWHPTLGYNTV